MSGFLTKVNDNSSVIDCALDAGALFEPKRIHTLLPNGASCDKTFTVYRELEDGSQAVLNAGVTKQYLASSYQLLFDTAEEMFPNSCNQFSLFGNGERVCFTQTIGELTEFEDGDELFTNLMYTGSMDSTWKTAVYGFMYRPACSNAIPMGTLQLAQKRTTNHDYMLFQKAKVLSGAYGVAEQFVTSARILKQIELNRVQLALEIDKILPVVDEDSSTKSINTRDKMEEGIRYYFEEESEEYGPTAWSLFQAVQSYEFHVKTKGNKSTEEKRQAKKVDLIRNPRVGQSMTETLRDNLLVLA